MREHYTLDAGPLDVTLQPGHEYLTGLTDALQHTHAGDRIALTTMSFEPSEPTVKGILNALHGAAERNVEIHFGVDAYTFLVDDSTHAVGPMLLPNPIRQRAFRERKRSLEELQQHPSVTVGVLNQPEHWLSNPYAHRSHVKAVVINDTSHIIGPNLHKTHRADAALSIASPAVSDKLYKTLVRLVTSESTEQTFEGRDQIWQLDDRTQLLIDAGRPHQSIILQAGLNIINTAHEELMLTSQYFPRGPIAQALASVVLQNNVRLTHFYNDPAAQGAFGRIPESLVIARQRALIARLPQYSRLSPHTHLHTKAVANETAGLIGSHNLDPRGVKFGTAEMSVYRHDPVFARRLADLVLEQAAQPVHTQAEHPLAA